MSDNAGGIFQSSGKFRQGDIAILSHQFFEKRSMGRKFPVPRWATLPIRLNQYCLAQFALPSHPSGGG